MLESTSSRVGENEFVCWRVRVRVLERMNSRIEEYEFMCWR